jgi:hypothetical protein
VDSTVVDATRHPLGVSRPGKVVAVDARPAPVSLVVVVTAPIASVTVEATVAPPHQAITPPAHNRHRRQVPTIVIGITQPAMVPANRHPCPQIAHHVHIHIAGLRPLRC